MLVHCSFCNKQIYGRYEVDSKSLVCGSCVFTETEDLVTKSLGDVQAALKNPTPVDTSFSLKVMDIMIKVKCNYARERWVDVGGSPVLFDENGIAEVPESMKSTFEELMRVKPGRFQFVADEAPPAPPAPVKEKAAPIVEAAPEKAPFKKQKSEKKPSSSVKKEGK